MRSTRIALISLATFLTSLTLPSVLFPKLPSTFLFAQGTDVCYVGQKLQILWQGKYYPATALRVSNDRRQCYITYDGYDNSWDEWVGSDRIQGKSALCYVGQKVQVYWKGNYYRATVLDVSAGRNRCYITYDGYDNSWDEWVGRNRLRF